MGSGDEQDTNGQIVGKLVAKQGTSPTHKLDLQFIHVGEVGENQNSCDCCVYCRHVELMNSRIHSFRGDHLAVLESWDIPYDRPSGQTWQWKICSITGG